MNFNSSFDDIGNEAGIKDVYENETIDEPAEQNIIDKTIDYLFDDVEEEDK